MSAPKISYSLTNRTSQARIAAIYQDIIKERYELVRDLRLADIVIIHHPPINYNTLFAMHPELGARYVISCCVPHGNTLSKHWLKNLLLVQEVWTGSRYCYDVLSRCHPNVVWMPYVVERELSTSEAVLASIKRLISYKRDEFYFLAMGPLKNPRKNIRLLVDTFQRVKRDMPHARLIIKAGSSDEPKWTPSHDIIVLPFMMPSEYVSALYQVADAFVSVHHVEAWGLGISDAMLAGIPVVATGYSGNMDYARTENSLLLPWRETSVPSSVYDDEWDAGMIWAEPDRSALERLLLYLYRHRHTDEIRDMVTRASVDIQRFNRANVAPLLWSRINSVPGHAAVA